MEAATQLHKMGLNPIIVEKSEALGGHIAQWDRLFPAFHPAKDVVEKMGIPYDPKKKYQGVNGKDLGQPQCPSCMKSV